VKLISGQIFNIINNQSDSAGDILEAVARITNNTLKFYFTKY
jgi:hypothetical protein